MSDTRDLPRAGALSRAVLLLSAMTYIAAVTVPVVNSSGPGASVEVALIGAFIGLHLAACVLAFTATFGAPPAPPRGILRLPRGALARWALGLAALFGPLGYLFTGNTMDSLFSALGLPHERLFFMATRVELGLLVVAALAGTGLAIASIAKGRRAFALGLPLVPGLLVIAFVAGEVLFPH